MKRIAVTGADRDPTGAHHLLDDFVAAVGGVAEGERVIIYLCAEPLECDAVVVLSPHWPAYYFARSEGDWRTSEVE
ncbi:hypothetical protein [Brevundimonas sp. Root1279]|uniref:hypothetical protein n=1 Tax=Brevundimonas sp. Root1279 TaxID=1736443 RepID=UPI0007013563|nr:hypothetical protein [Brevundimonas sp. Root1279]KQW83742.1 hypothetical protein ASC65_03570 [Brevundimonas sp. Root1279]